jgi:hypothetical protein
MVRDLISNSTLRTRSFTGPQSTTLAYATAFPLSLDETQSLGSLSWFCPAEAFIFTVAACSPRQIFLVLNNSLCFILVFHFFHHRFLALSIERN